jgi:hypothetical protein
MSTIGPNGMVTFTDRRQLRDGIRNDNLDYNFSVLATAAEGGAGTVGPEGPAGADGTDGADGIQGPQGPAGEGANLGERLDGGRSDSIYTADQSIIGGGA